MNHAVCYVLCFLMATTNSYYCPKEH